MKNHFIDDERVFKFLRSSNFKTVDELRKTIEEVMVNEHYIGVWIQKGKRDADDISVDKIQEACNSFLK